MAQKRENTGFICMNCGSEVLPVTNGSYRNHCPFCLYSIHVDITPGDRANDCMGLLVPTRVEYNSKKGNIIVYKCQKCGAISKNKVAVDTAQPDNLSKIITLMTNTN